MSDEIHDLSPGLRDTSYAIVFFLGDCGVKDKTETWRQSLLLAFFLALLDVNVHVVRVSPLLLNGAALLPEAALVEAFAIAELLLTLFMTAPLIGLANPVRYDKVVPAAEDYFRSQSESKTDKKCPCPILPIARMCTVHGALDGNIIPEAG